MTDREQLEKTRVMLKDLLQYLKTIIQDLEENLDDKDSGA